MEKQGSLFIDVTEPIAFIQRNRYNMCEQLKTKSIVVHPLPDSYFCQIKTWVKRNPSTPENTQKG